MEPYLVQPRVGEFSSPLFLERYAGVKVDVEVRTEFFFQPLYALDASFLGHQGVSSSDSRTGGAHVPGFLYHVVEALAWPLVGIHEVNLPPCLGQWAVIAPPMAVPSDEQYQFATHLALDASLAVRHIRCLWNISDLGQYRHSITPSHSQLSTCGIPCQEIAPGER